VHIIEFLLAALFLLHVTTGVLLTVENFLARPRRYQVDKNGGGRTIASQTMIYSGTVILLFIPVHLSNFHFRNDLLPITDLIREVLQEPSFALLSIVAALCLAVHVSHGFWSMFQTIGLDHPKYLRLIHGCTLVLSLFIGIIFILIPAAVFFQAGFLK
jgi:succinate dehydrogenase / fumarate reductase cytochrome b subunit